jgi:hypothetical protein
VRRVVVKAVEHFGKLFNDVAYVQELIVELDAARLAIPNEPVQFAGLALAFNDEADGSSRTTRAVWHARRKQKDFSRPDRDVAVFAVLIDDLERHVAFELVEKLFALVNVVILPSIRTADNHHNEVAVFPYLPIAYRWFE